MYEYITGKVVEKNPSYVVVELQGIGYFINISLHTYSLLEENTMVKLYIHQVIREDAHLFFGFFSKSEREIFRLLISVSGIGSNTARVILSSLTASEIQKAILNENVNLLKTIKGIGIKTAQRLILDLKDKVAKIDGSEQTIAISQADAAKEEALSALVMLGFQKNAAEKVLDKLIETDSKMKIEDLVKKALKML